MTIQCRKQEVGALLHAYELDALTEEDRSLFETHLLSCEFCFSQVRAFQEPAALLHADAGVRTLIREAAGTVKGRHVLIEHAAGLGKYLWPAKRPYLLRPAVICALLFLAAMPLFYGLIKSPEVTQPLLEPIFLLQMRSPGDSVFKKDSVDLEVIAFVFPDASAQNPYQLRLETADGRALYEVFDFKGFDAFGVGRLHLPHGTLGPGAYRLRVMDPRADPPLNEITFVFEILDD